MSVLVVYASRYGSTREIAERLGARLAAAGETVEVQPAGADVDPGDHEAFVIGSAAYFGSWLSDAVRFVRRNASLLSVRPVWVFTSGPLGEEATDAQGQDKRSVAVTKKIAELVAGIRPREHRVFFGVLDRSRLVLSHRLLAKLPATRSAWGEVEGDFRDWQEIEAWADSIARQLGSERAQRSTSRRDLGPGR